MIIKHGFAIIEEKMAKRTSTKEEQEQAKGYQDTFEAIQELHELMKKVGYSTGLGEADEEDYTKTVHLDIGSGTLYYDPYYQKLTYYSNDDCEHEIEEDDFETVSSLIKEIKKRFEYFQNKTKNIRDKAAKELFDKPIGNILKNLR